MVNDEWKLHDVIVKKPTPLKKAKEIANKFIPSTRKYYREMPESYRFRNISKQKFSEFRTKQLNDQITLIYGKLKVK